MKVYKKDDCVHLIENMRKMTVVSVSQDGTAIVCTWHSGKKKKVGTFTNDELIGCNPLIAMFEI